MKTTFRRIFILLLSANLFILACNAAAFLPMESSSSQGLSMAEEEITPITLPEQWTATPTATEAPTGSPTPTRTSTPDSFSSAGLDVTPYALEELGPGFTLKEAAIFHEDLPAGFISLSMQELLGGVVEGMMEGMQDMFPGELEGEDVGDEIEDLEIEMYNTMNMMMLINENSGTTITSVTYLFDTELDQEQFDRDLGQPPEAPPAEFPEPEDGTVYEFGLMEGFEPVGEVSQAVEMRMAVEDESGVEQSMVYQVVSFRRGAVGGSLMLMGVEGSEAVDIQQLAVLLDERAAAALEAAEIE